MDLVEFTCYSNEFLMFGGAIEGVELNLLRSLWGLRTCIDRLVNCPMKTKPRTQRGGSKKRDHESDGLEDYISRPTTRLKKLARRGNQNQGDHGETLQEHLIASPCTELATQEETLTVDKSGDKRCCSLQPQPPQPELRCYERGKSKNGGHSRVQKCPTPNVDAGQAMGSSKDLVVELGCDPPLPAAQFEKPPDLEENASNRASRKSELGNLYRWINSIKSERGITLREKFSLLGTEVRRFANLYEKKTDIEISNLKEEARFAMAKMTHNAGAAKDRSENQCRLLSEARSALQTENEILQEKIGTLQKENDVLQKKVEPLEQGYELLQKKIENLPDLEVLYRGHLKANVEAAENFGHEVKRGFQDSLKRMTQGEILSKILSLGEISRGLTLELQKRSQEQESCGKFIQLKPGEAHEHEELYSAKSGSYTDEAATPNLLDKAVFDTKADVISFQKVFFEVLKLRQKNPWHHLSFDVFFARSNHTGFYVRSVVNQIFFEGFENESFNTFSGVSRFLDPNHRQTKYYQYYKNNTGDIDDPQFRDFCGAKASSFWKMFPEYDGNIPRVCCSFEELGGPKFGLPLALSFRAAARSVWLLHKLAFSFEPPASIFRVECGADIDAHYMQTVVTLEDNERFVPKVGFMIAPGLRLGKNVMRSDVYLGVK